MFDSRRHAQSIASFGSLCQIRPYTVKATDPQLHSHVILLAAERLDGKLAAIESKQLYRSCVVMGWGCYGLGAGGVVTLGLVLL